MNGLDVQNQNPPNDIYAILNSLELSERAEKIKKCEHPRLEYLFSPPVKMGDEDEIIMDKDIPYGKCLKCGGTMIEIDEDYFKLENGIYIKSSQKDL